MGIYIAVILIITSASLGLFLILENNKKSDFRKIRIKSKKVRAKDEKKLQKYNILKRFVFFEYLLNMIEKSINPSVPDEDGIKIISLDILQKSTLVVIIFLILLIPFVGNVRIFVTTVIALIFIFFSTIDYFTGKIKTELLNHLVDFLDILRTKYFESGTRVDTALLETMLSLDTEKHTNLISEVEKLHEIIEKPNLDLSLREYYQIAPNSYFKILAGLLAITKENGDSISGSGSNFAKSLVDLGSEIKDEITFRNKLNFSLKSLNIIAIIPIFLMNPLRIWASGNFFPLQKFYNSSLGFISELTVLLSIVFAYYGINRIQRFREEIEIKNHYDAANFIYKKIKVIVDFIKPAKNTKRYITVNKRLKNALDFSTLEIHYTRKISLAFVAIIITLSTLLYSSYINKNLILTSPTPPAGYLGGELKGDELTKALKLSELDKEMIMLLENNVKGEEIVKKVEENYGFTGKEKNETVERIIKKYKEYKSNDFSMLHIVITYLIGFFAFLLRDISLFFKKKVVNMDAMTELIKFQLIITLLMHVKNIGVDDLLEWMEMFSSVYKTPIRQAIMDYDSGAEECLETLKKSTSDDEFKKLIEHMISAVDKVAIKTSFEELENEKKFYELKRKSLYERIVEKKSGMGKIVGFIPIYSVILIYFMFPLIYSGMMEMETYFKAL